MSSEIPSYSKIYNLGHRAITSLFDGPVIAEEKIDGSQFSFMRVGNVVYFRSRGQMIHPEAPPNLFAGAIAAVLARRDRLIDGWIYRGEVLATPKHNTLAYDRIPHDHVILFDIDRGDQDYLSRDEKREVAGDLQFEVVPIMLRGCVEDMGALKNLLSRSSCLGGQLVEGVVFKAYDRFGMDGKVLMGKYVSERFKEVHGQSWKQRHPGKAEIRLALIDSLRTEVRWEKAVTRLRDSDLLLHEPKDIGPLIQEIQRDVQEECLDDIKDTLWNWAKSTVLRGIVRGFPEWYKEWLASSHFGS